MTSALRMGRMYAIVLPDPVAASTMTSFVFRSGSTASWTGVGVLKGKRVGGR